MSIASFTEEQERKIFGGAVRYDVSVPISVVVNFSETGLDWKDALREEVRKKIITHVNNDDAFGFEFTGPHDVENGVSYE